jgi:mono/diheme cytochrome c family protein/glucose/arabinose dehydrogenase
MRLSKVVVAASILMLAGAAGVVHALQDVIWPPPVVDDGKGAPVLSAEESMKTIAVPPGYRVELVAKEPTVVDPILVDFDADGRMWVLEMPGFAMNEAMADSREPICRLVVVEDTDNDGMMDKRTVFADGLILPRALKAVDGGLLVGEPPNLWLMKDTDGDLKMDVKEPVADTYGTRERNIEHNANSLIWGLDNWVYTSEHDWHLRWKNGKFEVMPTLSRGQWGGSIDDAGRIYRNVNSAPLFVDFTLARYFVRNPNIARTRGLYDPVISLEEAVVWPMRPTRGVNRGYRDQFFRPDDTSWILQSAGTPYVYRGDRLPQELHGNVFVTDSTTNLVHRLVMVDDGAGRITAKNGYEKGEIFASSDERLRPVSLAGGYDGALYIVDMYRGVVQDVAYQTEYLQAYIQEHELVMPIGRGRIWRLVHETTELDRKPAMSGQTPAQLVQYLSHPNGWWRDMAQMLIVQRGDKSVVPAVAELARQAPDWRTRLHAMGVLAGLDSLDEASVRAALAHPHPDVRAWGLRWAEPFMAQPGHALAAEALKLMDDPNWIVRRQLAASIGELPEGARVDPAVDVLRRYGSDEMTVDATLSGLAGLEATVLDRLVQAGVTAESTDAVTMLAGALARSGDLARVQHLIDLIADAARPEWQRLALVEGLATGLPAGGGGRGGRGGGRGAGRGAAPAASGIALAAEPAALMALAAGTGPLSEAARTAVARLSWPGKPAPVVTVEPLTPEETARFEAGATVYKSLCIGCHLETGRGQEGVARSLVGSPYVVGPDAGSAVRVVLSGKEGTTGLMPPLGGVLSDEQIAAVLTYVRREWGHTASAVDPEDVREIRGLTSVRNKPWTDAELPAGRGGGGGGRGRAAGPAAGRGQ